MSELRSDPDEARHPVDCEGGWIPCWTGCDDGWFDEYDDDPINSFPGDMTMCSECHGRGGWPCRVCNETEP